jgi:hypothetical protein
MLGSGEKLFKRYIHWSGGKSNIALTAGYPLTAVLAVHQPFTILMLTIRANGHLATLCDEIAGRITKNFTE